MTFRFLLIFTAMLLTFSACKKDPCKDVVCLNHGVCDNGNCQCEAGFEGDNCEIEQRLAFVNDYSVEESCNLGNFNYDISIVILDSNATDITVTNFGDFGYNVVGTVDGTTFSIPSQVLDGDTIVGMGSLTDEIVSIDYTLITDQADTLICTMTCSPL